MMREISRLVLALFFAACDGSSAGSTDADQTDAGDAGPDGTGDCISPDTECPSSAPHPGGPCLGDLTCDYDADDADASWTYRCANGAWDPTYNCSVPGCSAVPPLAELCIDPFEGSLAGATVEVGPASTSEAFRPFEPQETLNLTWGPQGGAMVPFRVRADGADLPTCVALEWTMTAQDQTNEPVGERVSLHCGESLAVFAVFPFPEMLCTFDEAVGVRLAVEIAGLGETTADVLFQTHGCPR